MSTDTAPAEPKMKLPRWARRRILRAARKHAYASEKVFPNYGKPLPKRKFPKRQDRDSFGSRPAKIAARKASAKKRRQRANRKGRLAQ